MNRAPLTDDHIRKILNSADGQNTVQEICRRQGISRRTFYRWRAKIRAHDHAVQARRLRDLEMENGHLKQKVALLLLDYNALRVALINQASPSC